MPKFRKKPFIIEATQWFKAGDHPKVKPLSYKPVQFETDEHLNYTTAPLTYCLHCGKHYKEHGSIDSIQGRFIVVCPGDWIVNGNNGGIALLNSDIFKKLYEPDTIQVLIPANRKNNIRDFKIEGEDFEKFMHWNNKHKKTCKSLHTTIGGRLTYLFTPTGLGMIVKVKCVCGEEIDLTDESKW